jgi:periplasmic protein TonB
MVEEKRSAEKIGTLGSCLIEGDAEQKSRERKTKRRALTISIALQSIAIVALVVTPLLAKPEKLSFLIATPIPPYHHQPVHPVRDRDVHPQPPRNNAIYQPSNVPIGIVTRDPGRQTDQTDDVIDIGPSTPGIPNRDGLGIDDSRSGPKPPEDPERNKKRRITVGGDVQGAMLIRRVEPQYPPLARQLGRSGTVHIRAFISTDGNIESIQVLDGDPLLVQSAKDAVLQWHYRPTMLNGVPVEVETIIAVTYTLNR